MKKILLIFLILIFSKYTNANTIVGKGIFCSRISDVERYEKYLAIHIFDKKRIDVWTYPGYLKEEMHNYEIDGLDIYFIPNVVERTKFAGKLNRKDLTAKIMNIDYQCIAKDINGVDFTASTLKNYIEKITKKEKYNAIVNCENAYDC